MAGLRRRSSFSARLVAAAALATTPISNGACGDSTKATTANETPDPAPLDGEPAKNGEFAFEPTVRQNAPEGVQFRILMEVGNASEATLYVVTATYQDGRTPPLRVELWTFDQRDKRKLEPKGDPVWMLPLASDETPDGKNQLARLRRALSLPNSFKTRPVGLAADSPQHALHRLAEAAKRASTLGDGSKARLEGVETVFRGLGDDVFFDAEALPKVIALANGGELAKAEIQSSSDRRATAKVGETTIELLKKSDGWAVTGLE